MRPIKEQKGDDHRDFTTQCKAELHCEQRYPAPCHIRALTVGGNHLLHHHPTNTVPLQHQQSWGVGGRHTDGSERQVQGIIHQIKQCNTSNMVKDWHRAGDR